jgi:hypothetical protein
MVLLQRLRTGDADINRARSMPQQPWLIAGCSDDATVKIFDLKQAAPTATAAGKAINRAHISKFACCAVKL